MSPSVNQIAPNQIVKKTILKAPHAKVWRAVTDSREFGRWFGMKLDGLFVAGEKITGTIQPTTVDPEVAKMQKPFAGKPVELWIDRIEPETLFSMKWHPFAIDQGVDYSQEPKTLIRFMLDDQEEGVLLTIVESGFDQIPAARRDVAYRANDGGWEKQLELIAKYLATN